MNAKTKEHPADGIYYVDYKMLVRYRACDFHRERWYRFFGFGRVPLTLKVVSKMHTSTNHCVGWAVYKMNDKWKITASEFKAYVDAIERGNDYTEDGRRAFMDLLAARARREGRLP